MYNDAKNDLKKMTEDMRMYQTAFTIMNWEESTDKIPVKSIDDRATASSKLTSKYFEISISEKMNSTLKILEENINDLDSITKAEIRHLRKNYDSFTKVPVNEMQEFSKLKSIANVKWKEAKKTNNFDLFAPYLEEIIKTNKKFLDYRGYKNHPYNTLLDDYEEGMTIEKLDSFFLNLRNEIVPLLEKTQNSNLDFNSDFLHREIPIEKQKQLGILLMNELGYNFDQGMMLKETEHPFCTNMGKNDVRITTHYHLKDFLSSMYSVMHESGHAIYEQNVADELNNTFAGGGVSMGIHESQSRFFENCLGRDRNFWKYFYPKFMEIFKEEFSDISEEQFFIGCNLTTPSFIRTDSDELTYSLHIMIRYEIEKEIFSKDLTAYEIRDLWNEKYKEYLGITPKNDVEGILQDVHWSSSLIGYFPTYALGNAYASQLLHYLKQDINFEEELKNGNISVIKNWLTEKIHKYGSLKTPNDLFKDNFNEELNSKYYVDYLINKYTEIYNL